MDDIIKDFHPHIVLN